MIQYRTDRTYVLGALYSMNVTVIDWWSPELSNMSQIDKDRLSGSESFYSQGTALSSVDNFLIGGWQLKDL